MSREVVRIAMVAGEVSGDTLGAHLIHALKTRFPDAFFYGIGGPKMEREGFDAWYPMEKLAVRGLVEVLKHLVGLTRIRRALKKRLLIERPDIFIGIDAPDFNFALERKLKRKGIPTMHYVSPSIWAWRSGRINTIAKSVNHMLTLFPFEQALYEAKAIPVSYVGHPLADTLPLEDKRVFARELLLLPPLKPVFVLLPGSRQSELEYMADVFIKTARKVSETLSDALFLVPLATRETRDLFEIALYRCHATELPIRMLFGHAHEAIMASDVVLTASGTATLEAALLKRPMVIAYKVSRFTAWLVKRMYRLPYVGLPNILSGRFVVPEFLQDDATPENLAKAMLDLYSDKTNRVKISEIFRDLHLSLKQNTAEKAAAAVISCLPEALRKHAVT